MHDKAAIQQLKFNTDACACAPEALRHAIRAIEMLAKLRTAADAVRYGAPDDDELHDAMYAVLDELDAKE